MDTIEKAMKKMGRDIEVEALDTNKDGLDDALVDLKVESSVDDGAVSDVGAGGRDDLLGSMGQEPDLIDAPVTKRTVLDFDKLEKAGIIDPRSQLKGRTSEEFRHIKRPLLSHVMGKGASQVERPNLIMVTSSLAGEGKTHTAINLALSIAMERDKTVLLIDADVAKPEATHRLGVNAQAGLTDVLLDQDVSLKDVLIRTDIPNLTLLPAGRHHAHATELLASEAMHALADELSTRYADRVIIVDSPPLLLTNEARVLAGLMGQILVVIEESKTPQPVVQEALSTIESAEIVGLVLNKSHHSWGSDLYGGYGYGYGYGYGQAEK